MGPPCHNGDFAHEITRLPLSISKHSQLFPSHSPTQKPTLLLRLLRGSVAHRRPPARGEMALPFVFPSSLRDLERDTDGDDEPSLRPQNPVAVATLRAADLEESSRVTCRRLPRFPNRPHFLFRSGVAPVLRNYGKFWICISNVASRSYISIYSSPMLYINTTSLPAASIFAGSSKSIRKSSPPLCKEISR